MKRIELFMSIFVVLSGIFLCSCDKLFPDDKLILKRVDYTGSELRMDGYYYCYFENTDITVVYFLYRNGILRSAGGYSGYILDDIEKEMLKYYEKNVKVDWGVFTVNENKIQYEKWIEAPSGVRAVINRRSGYIENDTTFHITESYYSGTKETKQINEVWHFKQSANKPDSTNVYIK